MNALKSIFSSIKEAVPPVHPLGVPFILVFAVVAILLALLDGVLGMVGLMLTVWCVYFFRNPNRFVPQNKDLVISPADGVVSDVSVVDGPSELGLQDAKYVRISVFLNVFNVHVNRVPLSGVVKKLHYFPGKFLNANLDSASEENERQLCLVEAECGTQVAFVQIAGLIARRIICDLKDGQEVAAGERFGLIRFGSRTDIYVPEKSAVFVTKGQTMIGGETVLASLKGRSKLTFKED